MGMAKKKKLVVFWEG
uniref:Uncharacterized protein n=1 Tax=Arundo donax TaxID=35708 RepID=A0A0A8Y1T2_ARUDO